MSSGSSRRPPGYEVGFGRPPKANRFKPGQSGNPAGRPKRANLPDTAVEDALQELVRVSDKGRQRRIRALDVILRQVRSAAMRGHLPSAKFLFSQVPKGREQRDEYDLTRLSDEELAVLEQILSKALKS
jgi:hypothetical protein